MNCEMNTRQEKWTTVCVFLSSSGIAHSSLFMISLTENRSHLIGNSLFYKTHLHPKNFNFLKAWIFSNSTSGPLDNQICPDFFQFVSRLNVCTNIVEREPWHVSRPEAMWPVAAWRIVSPTSLPWQHSPFPTMPSNAWCAQWLLYQLADFLNLASQASFLTQRQLCCLSSTCPAGIEHRFLLGDTASF